MKKITSIIITIAALFSVMSCSTDIDQIKVTENPTAPVLEQIAAKVITDANGSDPFTFVWKSADFGVKTMIENTILVSKGGEFTELYSGINGVKYEVSNQEIAARLVSDLGLVKGKETTVSFRVDATIGSTYKVLSSNVINVQIKVD